MLFNSLSHWDQTNKTDLSRLSCLPHLPCDAVYRVKRFCYFIGVAKAYRVCPVAKAYGVCPVAKAYGMKWGLPCGV